MGSSGSKPFRGSSAAAVGEADAAASSGGRRRRSRSHWILPSSCLSSSSATHDSDDDEQVCSSWMRKSHGNGSSSKQRMRALENADCSKELKEKDDEDGKHRDEIELDECGEASVSNVPMRNGSSGRASSSSRSLTTPGRIFSHFRFIPGRISSRTSRASSSGSPNASPVSSSCQTAPNDREAVTSPPGTELDLNESRRENHMHLATSPSNCSAYQREHRVPIVDMHSPRGANETDSNYTSFLDRCPVVREPSERNVRFSRTLSVGRLRDRVLQRSSLSDFTFCPPPEHQGEDRDNTTLLGSGLASTASASETNPVTSISTLARSPSSIRRSLFGIQDHEIQTPRVREGRYRDLLEHRSNFLERRRRIQSQVRALQRMGSRIDENVSGHDGSCALGQNQAGHCTCRTNTTTETNARASISRIVMLAEALFEVLDEIHQQSVVLSSQPSVSSIGSVPAPNDVVDLLPVKLYTKSHKEQSDEALQCYICLLEYEEGDTIRTLPCHHEFHRTCVDKWLKEIHRVCPLCRGDICKTEQSPEGRS